MAKWYYAKGKERQGPFATFDFNKLVESGEIKPNTMVYGPNMMNWTPLKNAPGFGKEEDGDFAPPSIDTSSRTAHEIDYAIHGEEMQFVEIELDPEESAIAEAGSMMFMDNDINMTTVFGDASAKDDEGGFMGKLLGAGKRLITGESLFTTVFTHNGRSGKKKVAFASPYPGKIIPVDLKSLGGTVICQKDAFLAAAKGVSIGIHFQKKIGVGLFGGEGFIMQKLEGDGLAFLHAGGMIVKKELKQGEQLKVDTGCLVALDSSVNYDIETVGGVKSAIFGGEGFFLAKVTGPGTVWLQSLPFSRLAGKIYSAMPQGGGSDVGEGGLGGVVGDLIRGS